MKCPNCSKPVAWQDNPHRPFCSEHCKLVDLGRWVNNEYSLPGEPTAIRDHGDLSGEPTSGWEDEW